MTSDEGSALIQSFLNRGGSEKKAAQELSTSLGGLPLAIAHFAGYVARSQCPLDQICSSLNNRIKSSQIWNTSNLLQHGDYEMTLNTVWDLAFRRLSRDSRKLLEFLAFLDPDQVPIEMFVGSKSAADTAGGWRYWDSDRYSLFHSRIHTYISATLLTERLSDLMRRSSPSSSGILLIGTPCLSATISRHTEPCSVPFCKSLMRTSQKDRVCLMRSFALRAKLFQWRISSHGGTRASINEAPGT
ncbi:hypothetical protein J3459_011367 [Metarhizium acridum]|nr:hypothetical protein J3459_011367 [Metarhizium acridum]